MRQKGKGNSRKNDNITRGNKPESTSKRRKINYKFTKGKTIETKQDILKQRKKFCLQVGGDDTKTYQQPDAREAEQIWSKGWQQTEHKKTIGLATWEKSKKYTKMDRRRKYSSIHSEQH